MFKKSWLILYPNLLYVIGQDSEDIQCMFTSPLNGIIIIILYGWDRPSWRPKYGDFNVFIGHKKWQVWLRISSKRTWSLLGAERVGHLSLGSLSLSLSISIYLSLEEYLPKFIFIEQQWFDHI